MITNSFRNSKPKMTPSNFVSLVEKIDYCLIIFSHEIIEYILNNYKCDIVFLLNDCTGGRYIYKFKYNDKVIAFYNTYVGSCGTGNLIEESHAVLGCTNYIMFGSCGSLDKEKTSNNFIIPNKAYRDEGFSYHYVAASDYINIKNYEILKNIFDKYKYPYVIGGTWTTDAFYRETIEEINERKKAGDIVVEMEIAGAEAVCDYLNINLYTFLASGDVLSDEVYNHDGLHNANHDIDKFFIALKIIENL